MSLVDDPIWKKNYLLSVVIFISTDQGQGGGMAIEDGAALGVLFSNLPSKDEISNRLALFQRLRLDRVSAMQVFSSVGQDEAAKIAHLAQPYVKGPLPSKSQSSVRDYLVT